jgi:hypothetical protein
MQQLHTVFCSLAGILKSSRCWAGHQSQTHYEFCDGGDEFVLSTAFISLDRPDVQMCNVSQLEFVCI